ncbi:MAG: CcdB family protein [Steroidobacteraceae bacterium]
MARFDVYPNPDGNGLLVDIQADLMSHLESRVVVPLIPLDVAPAPSKILNPLFKIEDNPYLLLTQQLAAVPAQLVKRPIASLADRRDEIVAAVDLLLQGF